MKLAMGGGDSTNQFNFKNMKHSAGRKNSTEMEMNVVTQ